MTRSPPLAAAVHNFGFAQVAGGGSAPPACSSVISGGSRTDRSAEFPKFLRSFCSAGADNLIARPLWRKFAASFLDRKSLVTATERGGDQYYQRLRGRSFPGGRLLRGPEVDAGFLERQQAAAVGNVVGLVGERMRGPASPFILTVDDPPGSVGSFARTALDIVCKKSLVLPEKASRSSKQLCVAVDVDEVLGSFLATLNLFIEETYSARHDISEYYIYDFMKIWNCSQAEANLRVHAFFDSDHFKHGIYPIPGAHQSLLQLASHCQFVVVTSRQHIIRDLTLEWIDRYYAGIFKEVHFGNHFALEGKSRRKSEICRSLGAHVLIDDNPRYAIDCAECGIEVLLFDLHGGYPWSKTPCGPQHPLITRVKDWQEVERALLARTCAEL